jgi:adenosine deaminase
MTKQSYIDAVIKGLKAVEAVDVVLFDSNLAKSEPLACAPMIELDNNTRRKKIYVSLLLSIDRRETTSAALDTVCYHFSHLLML